MTSPSRSRPVSQPARRSLGPPRAGRLLDPQTLGDHGARLSRAAWALCGSREDGEDLVQETYAQVLARPRRLRGDDDLGYLLRAMRNTFVSNRRATARRPRAAGVDAEALDLPNPRNGATEPSAAAETHEVFGAIAALPDHFREALVAVDVAGLSYPEAARTLHVRNGTVASRVFRARERVASSLSAGPAEVATWRAPA